ncbi:hypothetical protein V1281_004282 [Nitrobacteraceae bacterium AZCC 2161]
MLTACSRLSTPPNRAVWGLSWRSAGRLSKRITDNCGRAQSCPAAPHFNFTVSAHPDLASCLGAAAACPVRLKAIALAAALIQSPKAQRSIFARPPPVIRNARPRQPQLDKDAQTASLDGDDFGVQLLADLAELLLCLSCCRFDGHQVWVFHKAGGGSCRDEGSVVSSRSRRSGSFGSAGSRWRKPAGTWTFMRTCCANG